MNKTFDDQEHYRTIKKKERAWKGIVKRARRAGLVSQSRHGIVVLQHPRARIIREQKEKLQDK
jgi:hypothetical protein